MASFEQRFAINEFVVPFISGSALARLCLVHHDFRAFQAQFIAQMHEMLLIEKPNRRLRFAAKNNCRALCELMREWGQAQGYKLNWNKMLFGAAEGGVRPEDRTSPKDRRELCELAHKWGQANGYKVDWNQMLLGAAVGGHRELCELAHSRGATRFGGMLSSAARCGHYEICLLACELASLRGADIDIDEMLWRGALGGHRDICELARSRGARGWNDMLYGAARNGSRELCELACEWAREESAGYKIDWDWMLRGAAQGGHRDICDLACTWSRAAGREPNWNEMFGGALDGNDPKVARELGELARSRGATDWGWIKNANYIELCIVVRVWRTMPGGLNDMLKIAAKIGHRELCLLVREVGIRYGEVDTLNYEEMLGCATEAGHDDICALARSLIMARNLRSTS